MKTKIVYTVVSTDKDIYLEQAMLSIYSLKKQQPDAHVVLFTDDITDATLTGKRAAIKTMIDEKIVVKREYALSAKESAYSLKTTFRESMQGDFLFIDTDTIVVDKLEEIDNCKFEVAAVPDVHVSYKEHFGHDGYVRLFKKLGFELKGDKYFNSGVMYVKDTPKAHQLYQRWNESYMSQKNKCFYDQPHLAKADSEVSIICELEGEWNCQIMYGLRYLSKAKIIHYFASNFIGSKGAHSYKMMDRNIFFDIKENGFNEAKADELIKEAKCNWTGRIEVVGGEELILLHSYPMKLLRTIFYKHPKIFKLIDNTINKLK